jgi:hypothetical protein
VTHGETADAGGGGRFNWTQLVMHQEDMQELDHFDKRLLPRNAHDALGHLHVRAHNPSSVLRELAPLTPSHSPCLKRGSSKGTSANTGDA